MAFVQSAAKHSPSGSKWHSHHIAWRTYGGSDTIQNQVLLHPNCHRQVQPAKLRSCEAAFQKERLEGLSYISGNIYV
ncbi:MAG: HNH endonuclease [Cyanobacteria bacterium J06635_10]